MNRPPEVVVPVPGSKSEAIRALILGALARGVTRIEGAPDSGDVKAVVRAIRALGVRVEGRPGRGVLRVRGVAGRLPPGDRRLDLGGSATGLRMLLCVALLREGRTVLDGDASLRNRRVGPVFTLFPALGIRIRARSGRPPVTLSGGPVLRVPDTLKVFSHHTSQIPSGLLIAGPFFEQGLRMKLTGRVVSSPYLDLTVRAMRRVGVTVRRSGRKFEVPRTVPKGVRVVVESDWSSAVYPLIAGAILGRRVRVPGLDPRSPQADRAILGLLRKAGVRCGADKRGAWCEGSGRVRPFSIDLRDAPDLAPAAAALALFADGVSRVRGAAHLQEKESDRIAASVAAVRSFGGRADPITRFLVRFDGSGNEIGRPRIAEGFAVRGGAPRAGAVDPQGDHRIALAFGVAAAAIPGARLLDRGCVSKSWPTAWRDLAPLLGPPAE